MIFTALSLLASSWAASLPVCPDPENLFSSRYLGAWKVNVELSERLHGGPLKPYELDGKLVFVPAPEVVQQLPDLGRCPVSAGYLTMTYDGSTRTYPYVVTEFHGQPKIVYYKTVGFEIDSESLYVMFARGPEDDFSHDLLFVGGDFNNGPHLAFDRVPATPAQGR